MEFCDGFGKVIAYVQSPFLFLVGLLGEVGKLMDDGCVLRVVDEIDKFLGVVLEVEEFGFGPREVVEFPVFCANHEDWGFADVAVVVGEYVVAEVVFGVDMRTRGVVFVL